MSMVPDPAPAVSHRAVSLRTERRGQAHSASGGQQHREHWDDIQPVEIEDSALDDVGVALFGVKSVSFKNGGSYRILYTCVVAAAFANAMTFSVLAPFLPDYLSSRFGSSSTQVGLVMATYPAVNLVTSPLIGWLMSRYGRFGVLLMGLVMLTVATMMYALAPRVIWLYIASGLHGASLSLIHVSSLALLSAFPERVTESMAGIEVWSGMASIIGPPLGGLACLWGGVPSAFLIIAIFPFVMVLVVQRIQRLVHAAKDVTGEAQPVTQIPFWRVLFNRRVLAGAFATSFDCGVIGFLEPTLSPHLTRSWASSPRAMGFIFVVPNIVYTCMASKAQAVIGKVGVKKTVLYGLGIMGLSLALLGPSPVLSPVLPSRVAARTSIGIGLLLFEVGSALVSVPTFAVMQGGVSSMGSGADNAVASVHSLSIGLGEVIGPVLGGMMMEILPQSLALACDPRAFIQETMIPEGEIVAAESSQKEGADDRYHSNQLRSRSSASTEEQREGVGARRTLHESNIRLSSESELETLSSDSQIVTAVGHVEHIELSRVRRYREEQVDGGGNRAESREGELGGVRTLSSGWPVLFSSVRLLENEGVNKDLRLTPAVADESVESSKVRAAQVEKEGGNGEIGTVMSVGDENLSSCDTAFPTATTLIAWIPCLGILAVHRLLPRHKVDVTSRSTGERTGVNTV